MYKIGILLLILFLSISCKRDNGDSIDSKLNNIGAQMNATTWNDRTNYDETIPSNKIKIELDIEADRMRNSLLLKKDKDVKNSPNNLLSREV